MAELDGGVKAAFHTLVKRCIDCPLTVPACPVCPAGEECSMSIRTCNACPSTSCIRSQSSPSGNAAGGSSRPNVGAIAGGVIGGIASIAVLTWLVWRCFIKPRRRRYEAELQRAGEDSDHEQSVRNTMPHHDRASMRTVGSTASTVFTRASNIIQIAYIPGVTNRSPPSTPALLVPPVPPLPLPLAGGSDSALSTPLAPQEQHFFMPDLRDSTYSGLSDSSFARESMTPSLARSSVATTIYRNNAVVNPVPVQTGIRGKAAVVSVKSSSQSSPNESRTPTPPVPAVDYERYGGRTVVRPPAATDDPEPLSPAFSVGSTFLNSTANTAKVATAKPVSVRKPSGGKPVAKGDRRIPDAIRAATAVAQTADPLAPLSRSPSGASKHSRARRLAAMSSTLSESSEDDEPGTRARRSLIGHPRDSQQTYIEDTPVLHQSPFSAGLAASPAPETSVTHVNHGARKSTSTATTMSHERGPSVDRAISSAIGHERSGSLSAAIEEAARRASRQPTHGGLGSDQRDKSPFSDANEAKTP